MGNHKLLAFLLPLLLPALFMVARPIRAADPPAVAGLARFDHYCISCHSSDDPHLAGPLGWYGGSSHALHSPCPAVSTFLLEAAYTDQALDAIANGENALMARFIPASSIDARLATREQGLARVVNSSYRTVDAGVNQVRALRLQLNKSYAQVGTARGEWTSRVLLAAGLGLTLALAILLLWGYRNTRGVQLGARRSLLPGLGGLVFIFLIVLFFGLPLLKWTGDQTDVATAADTERQAALDAATAAAVSAENESARSWQLAQLAQAWQSVNASGASLALTAAFSSTAELESNADAYWGRTRALEESAVGWETSSSAVVPVVQRVEVASARVWSYAALVDAMSTSDPRAPRVLEDALARTGQNPDPYFRSLDLKKLSIAWARLNAARARSVANSIPDPFIRAWALSELASRLQSPDLSTQAAASIEQIADPVQAVFALRELALATQDAAYLDRGLALARAIADSSAQDDALANLAAASARVAPSRAPEIVNSISPVSHGARARARLAVGEFADAWAEAEKIDGYERFRAQEAIVAGWARGAPDEALAAAGKIGNSFWQAEAQYAVVAALASTDPARACKIAQNIVHPFARVQALTDCGRATKDAASLEQAATLAKQLADPYPLLALIQAWAPLEPQQALALVDHLNLEGDRARALLAVALALAPSDHVQANALFDRAVRQAQAARLFGDALHSVNLLQTLAVQYATIDPAKANEAFRAALDAAQKITTAF